MITVLGLDAGGSNTRALLAKLEGEVLGRGSAGPGNPLSAGWEAATSSWRQAIDACYVDAQRSAAQPVTAAWLGIAGCGRPEPARLARQWALGQGFAQTYHVASDAENALWTHENGIGAVLVAGTGTIALWRDLDRQVHRIGGWGPRIDDRGGGYWIARQGLRAVAHAVDGRADRTMLVEEALDYFGVVRAEQLSEVVHASSVARVAEFARRVSGAAARGDGASKAIVEGAANHLFELALDLHGHCSLERLPLALAGGLFEVSRLRERLRQGFEEMGLDVRMQVVEDTEHGTLEAAREFARVLVHPIGLDRRVH